jgi:DNA-binding LytR/AlgR family response regulator
MKKLNCIIADDEPVARKILQEFIEQVPFLSLAGQFENAIKAQAWLQQNNADLLFLDIEMPKMKGLDYLRKYEVKPLVILTTAYTEYALEGYELDIIDYLLKPIAFHRFVKAVQKAKDFLELKENSDELTSSSYIFVRSDKRIERIMLSDICYIESMGNYVKIITENKKVLAYLTLKGIEAQLPSANFIKLHQSYLVNFSRIEALEGNSVRIKDALIPVGRHYRDSLMQIINERLLRR